MEKSESSQRDTVQELNERQGHIARLETDLRQAKRENTYLVTENQQLKVKVDQLKEEVQKLTSISHSLENRLEMEQASVGKYIHPRICVNWKRPTVPVIHTFEYQCCDDVCACIRSSICFRFQQNSF